MNRELTTVNKKRLSAKFGKQNGRGGHLNLPEGERAQQEDRRKGNPRDGVT